MAIKPLVLVVNGYGTIIESPLGHVYLPKVKRVAKEEQPELIVFCGSFTFLKTMPNDSEASVMADWYMHEGGYCPPSGIIIEDCSYTTLENSGESAKVIRPSLAPIHGAFAYFKVIHMCEATRAANVVMCDQHFMIQKQQNVVESIDDITVETASWERADPFRQAKALLYNKMAIKYPWLGLAERERRKRIEASKHR